MSRIMTCSLFALILAVAPHPGLLCAGERVTLFDGKTLEGWDVLGCEAVVQDGAILLKAGNGLVQTKKRYGDFVLEYEWKALKSTAWDSGVYFRYESVPQGSPWPPRYQVNLRQGGEGDLVDFPQGKNSIPIKAGDWNSFELTVKGRTASLKVNGQQAWHVDGIDVCRGYIALQAEIPGGGQCLFRNIRLAELDAPTWEPGQKLSWGQGHVTLSQPVLVARSKGYLWFPSLARLSDGRVLAVMSNYADEHVTVSTASFTWSADEGRTWTPLIDGRSGDPTLTLANGDELLLPYYLRPLGERVMGEVYQICKAGQNQVSLQKDDVIVRGWSRPDQPFSATTGMCGFVFDGDTLLDKDKNYLATLYGHYKDTARYALVLAESKDGVNWTIRSTIAGESCGLEGAEGPCECAMCRLPDGRLMSVFRLASNVPYGQSFSSDEGRTWSEAQSTPGVFSVQPSLSVLPGGTIALSGGRPGIYLWLNRDGKGLTWDKFDIVANHNQFVPQEPITDAGKSSSYTEVITLDDKHLLLIYDRIPHSWSAIPADSSDTNSVWVTRITLEP